MTGFNMKKKQHKNNLRGESTAHRRTIVGLFFHPASSNYVCILQDGGDIHIVDASNGTIAYEYVGKAKINSNWAVDKDNQRVLIVGDIGKATLLDINIRSIVAMQKLARAFLAKTKQQSSSFHESVNNQSF